MFLYCKYQARNDQNCGKGTFDFNDEAEDLRAYAKFYSNESLRQFLIAFFTPQEIRASRAVQAVNKRFPGWYKVGLFIELYANATENIDAALLSSAVPAVDLLQTYAAVAIFEDYENGLHLFRRALNIPGLEWVNAFKRVKNAKMVMHSAAWSDVVIQEILWLDLLLYDHAVSVYEKQLKRYGMDWKSICFLESLPRGTIEQGVHWNIIELNGEPDGKW